MNARLNSGLYTGWLHHRRERPRIHEFRFPVYQVLLDLDDLDQIEREMVSFGHNRRALTACSDADHGDGSALPVGAKLDAWRPEEHRGALRSSRGSGLASRSSRSDAGGGASRPWSLEPIGVHCAETLRRWCEAFLENRASIGVMGYLERFLRFWKYYLAYCEGGFASRFLHNFHMVLTREGNPELGPVPAYRGLS